MSKRKMEELKYLLCDELDKIADKGSISAGDLETAHKLTDTIKNIEKIGMLEETEAYSQRGYYSRDNYDRGNSYGHYTRGYYSRDNDYSGEASREYLQRMEQNAPDDRTRETIRRMMSNMS